jgi:class 3 adenylate cyclase/pimeloyl-ACP methyl ester carboxylesterase
VKARTIFGYARPDDGIYIGYRIDGEGPIDIVVQPDWPGNIDHLWQDPSLRPMLESFASFARVIVHDHRGVGLSSRNVEIPNLESRVSDLLAVLSATATRRPVLVGALASGAVNVLLAATHPRLPRAIVWMEPTARYSWAPDYPWGVPLDEQELERASLGLWGTENYSKAFVEEQAALGNEQPPDDPGFFAMQSRNACTPDVALKLDEMWSETDVRGVLEAVNVPTLLLVHEERKESIEKAEYIASRMPAAELRLMPGLPWTYEETPAWVDAIREFIGQAASPVDIDTVLSTALFTDIVGSTERQASLGDRGWRDLVSRHHSAVRDTLDRYHGTEMDTAGDGFYATFDGPARAIRSAFEICDRVRALGIEIRAGVHTGECQVIDGKIGGIAVTIGARISAMAGASEVLISQTVKDLVAGSGFVFEDAGEHELKGVPDRWHVYRVADGTAPS